MLWEQVLEGVHAEDGPAAARSILAFAYFWYNFMPLARGTAAAGYIFILSLFLAAGMPITASIPKASLPSEATLSWYMSSSLSRCRLSYHSSCDTFQRASTPQPTLLLYGPSTIPNDERSCLLFKCDSAHACVCMLSGVPSGLGGNFVEVIRALHCIRVSLAVPACCPWRARCPSATPGSCVRAGTAPGCEEDPGICQVAP